MTAWAVLMFFCFFILIIGGIFTHVFEEPLIIVFTFVVAIFMIGMGGMAIEDSSIPEKCYCEETVQVETCEDCGGIIE